MRNTMMMIGSGLLLAGTAIAQDTEYGTDDAYQPEAPAADAPAGGMSVDDTFAVIDADADGTVTETEFVSYAGTGSETQFASMAGDDGALTLDELQSFMEQGAGAQ